MSVRLIIDTVTFCEQCPKFVNNKCTMLNKTMEELTFTRDYTWDTAEECPLVTLESYITRKIESQ